MPITLLTVNTMAQSTFEKPTFSAGELDMEIASTLKNWQQESKVERLWQSDATLWTNTDEANWTGWLTIPKLELSNIDDINQLTKTIQIAGFTDVVLLGMGGSSLCAAMIATTFNHIINYPQLHVLDSTDPQQIDDLEKKITLEKTFFIVASKSGTTLEPNILKAYFYTRLQTVLNNEDIGSHFAAITDPGTSLEKLAETKHFKALFHGIPSIGGRYSALSNFGMLPSGLMGIDVKKFLEYAEQMAQCCGNSGNINIENNPGVILGILLGICEKHGKDKVTLVISPAIHALGAWLEQLLAESTGKMGKGLIPVDQEPLGKPNVYGNDRVFAYVRFIDAPDATQDRDIEALEQAGQVVIRLHLQNKMHLGAAMFQWEFATAVAGSIIGINPFNQPDVEGSKVRTLALTKEYEETNKLNELKPIATTDDLQLMTDTNNIQALKEQITGEITVESLLKAHLARLNSNDYFDLSAFIAMNTAHTEILQKIRLLVRDHKKVATCLGFGPRFLHSTGQAYKGGPNTGVFLQITADHAKDIPVPGHKYTFGLVINAQAQGDFEVLTQRKRRVLRVHLGVNIHNGLQKLYTLIQKALTTV